jgi:ethanolamine utilization cobalamin adenosyltransferase
MFGGKLDTLQAQMIGDQLVDAEEDISVSRRELRRLGWAVSAIQRGGGLGKSLTPNAAAEYDRAQIAACRTRSRGLGIDHPIPHYRMGRLCVALNRLRTQVREAELYAAAAFTEPDGACAREDIVEALNRLSSCVYILFCRKLAGFYTQERAK